MVSHAETGERAVQIGLTAEIASSKKWYEYTWHADCRFGVVIYDIVSQAHYSSIGMRDR